MLARFKDETMKQTLKLLINGRLVEGAKTLDVINPATGETFITVPRADKAQALLAIAAAKAALPAWSALTYAERATYLTRFADGIRNTRETFAQMMTREQGKPIEEARWEVDWTIGQIEYHASLELKPELIRENSVEKIVEQRAPLGVVAAIAPWNYPMQILIAKVGGALITGNTVIAKPAPTTPGTALMMGEVAAEIFPAGVFQTLVDENDLGPVLTTHPDIAYVSFTGSTVTGKKVLGSTVETLKRATLELGGNDAAIVLDDVDIKAVAARVYRAGFLNAGQICFAAKRVYVPNAIMAPFVAELVALAAREKVGDGLDAATTMGPVQNRMQYDKVRAFIDEASQNGTVVAGGEIVAGGGYFIPPTIITGLADDERLVVEEQFGPVMPVLGYDDIEDVIRRANDSEFGLGASVWSSDPERGMAVASRIDSGTVWVNTHVALPFDVPFGGAKQSGIGQQGGIEGLKDFTQVRIVNASLV
jgi:acyl-CoA reductase-like NAD-dependent aldehyde dehydrogenase